MQNLSAQTQVTHLELYQIQTLLPKDFYPSLGWLDVPISESINSSFTIISHTNVNIQLTSQE